MLGDRRSPPPAAISAAVVETLKVERAAAGAGGVDQVLRLSISTCAASDRIVRARPTSSGTVSPFARRAIRKAAGLHLARCGPP